MKKTAIICAAAVIMLLGGCNGKEEQPVFAEKDFVTSLETALCTVDFENGADSSISGTIFRRGVCLPSDTKMDEEDLDRICTVIEGLW